MMEGFYDPDTRPLFTPEDFYGPKNFCADIPFVKGPVWTTDAFYRETERLVTDRKNGGCLAVEMELAGVQAVCDHYGWHLYDFLETGDVVETDGYDISTLSEANHDISKLQAAFAIIDKL